MVGVIPTALRGKENMTDQLNREVNIVYIHLQRRSDDEMYLSWHVGNSIDCFEGNRNA